MKKQGSIANVFSFTPQKKEEIQILRVSIHQETGHQIILAQLNGKEVYLQPFNIRDKRPRKVLCISGGYGCVKGCIYNVVNVNVGSCKTNLALKETGLTTDNSVNFAEIIV